MNLNAILPAEYPNDFGKSRIATIGDGIKGSIQTIKKRRQRAIIDDDRNVAVLFGGIVNSSILLGDTWELNIRIKT